MSGDSRRDEGGDTPRMFEDDYDEFEARLLTDPTVAARMADELVPEVFTEITVPEVIGLTQIWAVGKLHRVGLVAADPDGARIRARFAEEGIVVDQSPAAGAVVPCGTLVMLQTDRSGGTGVREPRRPLPDPRTGRAMRDETTGEAVT